MMCKVACWVKICVALVSIFVHTPTLGGGCSPWRLNNAYEFSVNLNELENINDEKVVADLAGNTCSLAYPDQMRVQYLQQNSSLDGTGFTLYFRDDGGDFSGSSATHRCVVPFYSRPACPEGSHSYSTKNMYGKLVIKRTGGNTGDKEVIKAGAQLGALKLQWKGLYNGGGAPATWGHHYIQFNVINAEDVMFKTCAIDSSNQHQIVSMPTISSSEFTGVVGSTYGSTDFSLKLDCQGGVRVYASVSDANDSSNSGSALSLDTGSSGSGVGIQLAYDGEPVSFGKSFYVAGNNTDGEVSHHLNFVARYVQTKTTINPGSISAKAVVLFEYL